MIDLIRRSSEDQKLVNHDEDSPSQVPHSQTLSPGVKYGLLASGVMIIVAMVAGAVLF